MKLYVIFGQRKELYPGEYGLEALEVMSEYDMDGNPEYLPEKEEFYNSTKEFSAIKTITLDVSEKDIRAILTPENDPIYATVFPL